LAEQRTVVTGTGLSSGGVDIDARWSHFGADHWVEGHPTEEGQGAALDLSAALRKPELLVAGECLAEGPRQTLPTMLHEAVHAWPMLAGQGHLSGGKYHNKREFVALAGELGLAWPQGQRPHPVIGFSEVQLTEQTVADYTDTFAYIYWWWWARRVAVVVMATRRRERSPARRRPGRCRRAPAREGRRATRPR
jgi:hypothetical protein